MNKICLIRQPAGIGDIFFCQKIGYHFQSQGYKIIWPVAKVFKYMKDYITNFDYICEEEDFIFKDIYLDLNIKEVIEKENFLFVPLHGHNLRNSSVMHSKYNFVGIPFFDWLKYFNFTRNTEKENELFYNILRLKNDEEYIFLNKKFASPPGTLVKDIQLITNKKIIELDYYERFSIFDWCKVLENASEIHTVETSLNYLIEKLDIKAKLNMYSKWTPSNYSAVKGIFKKKWVYHD